MALTDYVIMPGADYQNLCSTIRGKTGKSEPIKSGDLVTELLSVLVSSDKMPKIESGSISGDGVVTVAHGLGVVPDIIIVYTAKPITSTNYFNFSLGFSTAMHSAFGGGNITRHSCILSNGGQLSYNWSEGFENAGNSSTALYGNIREVTSTSFKIGGTSFPLFSDAQPNYIAISGLI